MSKIKQTSADKVHGKTVKYRRGDCFSIVIPGGRFLAAFISFKFNKYYDIVLLQYLDEREPCLRDFREGEFFGTRFGSIEETTYAVHIEMMECKYVDNCESFRYLGNFSLISNIQNEGESYSQNINELLEFYLEDLPIRIQKSANAARFPEIGFVSKHLIAFENILCS